jgi:hypothetical protein
LLTFYFHSVIAYYSQAYSAQKGYLTVIIFHPRILSQRPPHNQLNLDFLFAIRNKSYLQPSANPWSTTSKKYKQA